MNWLFGLVERVAGPLLRISLGLLLLWIGGLKFTDPSPSVGLLHASLPFLAFKVFVYALGALEIAASILLFAGTLTIFVTAPSITYVSQSFPYLSLAGQFLLKDFVLAAAAIAMVAVESVKVRGRYRVVPQRVAA